ncbi:MAG: N(4)-(beta-N-acetylglucosaminyl)-L-asparaginase [candidate division Zixibacteria bacterium]|nr:N(4)-(beta-N-acetylglucosaminyl)-L-asparaginase [candidate division Zixibacteria bacterium]
MIVVCSGPYGLEEAMKTLKNGGSAIDAVEAGCRAVESDLRDTGVGLGGAPNILGVVELDAQIMDGKTLNAGMVGCVSGYEHPISIARCVMEKLLHVFLVGKGAERFASEMGFEKTELLTDSMREIWLKRLCEEIGVADPAALEAHPELWRMSKWATDPYKMGTVNYLVQDANGDICSGVSTSGWGWKYPGRLGDSPVLGAGGYADNRYGAAACTGAGEMAIRVGSARSVVVYMKMGLGIEQAVREALRDLNDLHDQRIGGVNVLALDKDGNHLVGNSGDSPPSHWYMTPDMTEPAQKVGICEPYKKG